jgi:hypothetical protein
MRDSSNQLVANLSSGMRICIHLDFYKTFLNLLSNPQNVNYQNLKISFFEFCYFKFYVRLDTLTYTMIQLRGLLMVTPLSFRYLKDRLRSEHPVQMRRKRSNLSAKIQSNFFIHDLQKDRQHILLH